MDRSISRPGAFWIALCGLIQLIFGGPAQGRMTVTPPSAGAQAAGGRYVLLVHGIYNSAIAMEPMKRFLESHGWQVYTISIRPNNASVSFETMAEQLRSFVDANIPAGRKFDLVGFSMGGLVCRYYVQKLGGDERVRRFVTLSTPNHGTIWANLGSLAGVKEMRPRSEMLRELNGDTSKLTELGYTSIYTPFDLSIVPARSSYMPGARNIIVWVPMHPLMVLMPAPLHAVRQALQ